jgi:mono/diheme cytochrome c family protein
MGPDGLYFAPILPNDAGMSAVYRVTYDPTARYPHRIELDLSGSDLFQKFGCRSCHSLDNVGGDSAPKLDRPALAERISARLASQAYRQRVAALDKVTAQPFDSYRGARKAVLGASEEDQVALWIKYRLLEPKFDDPQAAMPKLGLTEKQAAAVADYLLHGEAEFGVAAQQETRWQKVRRVVKTKKFEGGVAVGFGGAVFLFALAWLALRRRRPAA